ncbi:uncharacterized protein GGS22DRAFT_199651 [Annulohypoxylon maeteangense]|uniref:uncharacterized protein n=1 Tax=Annulohypoxylon maeteangense TaxID=1927788 RepID=UPI002008E591|nr:uncharacterized protein GGS22DRAFT_199651 [Annulohypoxylon maeteangense]KAI0886379.1 hypothetical protein GGS22DRAFT_199651 [Annulohypoxylon maeteangense]
MDSEQDPEQGPNTTARPQVDRVAPPAYDNFHAGLGNTGLPIPPPATNGKFYFESQAEETIELGLCPEPPYHPNGDTGPGPQTWFARLKFKCDNVPQLMREGLHWSLDNVQWEDGYMDLKDRLPEPQSILDKIINRYCLGYDLTHTRHYFLRDLQVPSRWIAHLQVHAGDIKDLSDIRLENISIDNICYTYAFSVGENKNIYGYETWDLESSFNAVYDDTPLEGWWPWPKKDRRRRLA